MDLDKLRSGARLFGLRLGQKELEKFDILARLLRDSNRRANLVGSTEAGVLLTHHFLDSLSCFVSGVLGEGVQALDLGSGAGLPGLPLAIAQPGLDMTLLDSAGKRTDFLKYAVAELDLDNARVVTARAEDAGRDLDYRDRFDTVVARAVAALPVLTEYALPFLRPGGSLVSQRGPKADEEARDAADAVRELNGRLVKIIEVDVPFLEAKRRLVIIEKTGPTPDRYPRRSGIPAKRPITGS